MSKVYMKHYEAAECWPAMIMGWSNSNNSEIKKAVNGRKKRWKMPG